MRRVETMGRGRSQACNRRNVTFMWSRTIGVRMRWERLMTHDGGGRRNRGQVRGISIAIATSTIGTRIVRTVTGFGIRMRRLRRMRILVVRVIIRKGALVTDSVILRGSLSMMLIWLSGRAVLRRRVWVARCISLWWWWRVGILRLTRGTRRTKRLTMGSIEHWRLTVPGIAVFTRTFLTRNSSSCIWTVNSRDGNESSLRANGMEETLLIKADAILASSVRRTIIA
jgi:hypothetical protein